MQVSSQNGNNVNILCIEDFFAGYDGEFVIKHINTEIRRGEIISILGANGSGKSTLLKALVNLINIKGKVIFKNTEISRLPVHKIIRSGVSILHQYNNVFLDLTVAKNLEINNPDISKKDLFESIEKLNSASTGLFSGILKNDIINKRTGLLSGGEKQKLALLMTLSSKSDLYLLDEPTASLSTESVKEVMSLIKQLSSSDAKTFIIVEQNIKSAMTVSDRVFIMKNGFLNSTEDTNSLMLENKLEEIFLR